MYTIQFRTKHCLCKRRTVITAINIVQQNVRLLVNLLIIFSLSCSWPLSLMKQCYYNVTTFIRWKNSWSCWSLKFLDGWDGFFIKNLGTTWNITDCFKILVITTSWSKEKKNFQEELVVTSLTPLFSKINKLLVWWKLMNQTCPAQKQKGNYMYKESLLIHVQCLSFWRQEI